MKTRHKPPSLVSMWMLDVFCCALGCVTLLWLLSTREAKDEATRNRTAVESLARTEADLLATRTTAADRERLLTADATDLTAKLAAAAADRDDARRRLAVADAAIDESAAKLTAQAAASAELATKLGAAAKAADDATKLARDRAAARQAAAAELADVTQKLAASRAEAKAGMRAAGDAVRATKDDLAAARAAIIDLQGQKAKLADKLDKLKADADARFAGIALTGRRVVFVVDTSGSMKLLDDKTPAPDKWPTVIDTVSKVMRSLAELDQYQVITFSRKADSLFPAGEWQPYTGEASVKRVADALRRVNPDGDTNMYDALDLAFRLRPGGLDTVYLFSDGLPTSGPGLTAAEERTATAADRSEKLSKHVLRTLRTSWNRAAPGGTRVRVNCVGFFFESPDVGAFLWALARDNDGSFVGMSRP